MGIGEDLPERVTLEVPLTHAPERIVMGRAERFGVCRASNRPYATVDRIPSCKQWELERGRVAVVVHFGGYKMECWDPVQRWDARLEWGPDGSYSRINAGETRHAQISCRRWVRGGVARAGGDRVRRWPFGLR